MRYSICLCLLVVINYVPASQAIASKAIAEDSQDSVSFSPDSAYLDFDCLFKHQERDSVVSVFGEYLRLGGGGAHELIPYEMYKVLLERAKVESFEDANALAYAIYVAEQYMIIDEEQSRELIEIALPKLEYFLKYYKYSRALSWILLSAAVYYIDTMALPSDTFLQAMSSGYSDLNWQCQLIDALDIFEERCNEVYRDNLEERVAFLFILSNYYPSQELVNREEEMLQTVMSLCETFEIIAG